MTVYIGYWAIPLVITFSLLVWALTAKSEGPIDLVPLFKLAISVILSLVGWLIWALLR